MKTFRDRKLPIALTVLAYAEKWIRTIRYRGCRNQGGAAVWVDSIFDRLPPFFRPKPERKFLGCHERFKFCNERLEIFCSQQCRRKLLNISLQNPDTNVTKLPL